MEIMNMIENQRWQPGCYNGFWIGLKFYLDMYHMNANTQCKFHINWSKISQKMCQNQNLRWQPGGHIGLEIGLKLKQGLYITI